MDTIPVGPAELLCAGRSDLAAALASAGRQVGRHVEIDTDATNPTLAAALTAYWRMCAHAWRNGRPTPAGTVDTRRTVAAHEQVAWSRGRKDLTDVYRALTATPDIARIVDEATAESPDIEALNVAVHELGGSVDATQPGVLQLTLPLPAGPAFDELLGGGCLPGEVLRIVTVTCRQASWRNRRVRRLAAVTVDVVERWPDPTRFRTLLPPQAA